MTTDGTFSARAIFVFGDPPNFFEAFDAPESIESPLKTNLLTLKANLLSGLRVGTIPTRLAQAGIFNQRYNQLVIAEKIRCQTKVEAGEITKDQLSETALRFANQRMADELANDGVLERHTDYAVEELNRHLRDIDFLTSAQELLRQILVIGWGAFEIFVNDTIRILLNERPRLLSEFAEVKPYRDYLSTRMLMDALQARNFNLSTCMGDIFADVVKLDSLEKIRDAIRIALSDASVDILLKDERLWRLSQQRHLIVHRRGIIDNSYVERTSDHYTVGDYLTVDADYVERSLALVRDIGCHMFWVAHRKLTE